MIDHFFYKIHYHKMNYFKCTKLYMLKHYYPCRIFIGKILYHAEAESQLLFCSCDKIIWQTPLKRGRVSLTYSSMVHSIMSGTQGTRSLRRLFILHLQSRSRDWFMCLLTRVSPFYNVGYQSRKWYYPQCI